MIRILAQIFIVLLSINTLFAQGGEAVQLDDFSESNSEMLESRLDMYSQALLDNPGASLQILIHRGEKQSFGAPYRLAAVMKNYVVDYRNSGDRVSITQCETEKEKRAEVWTLPVGVRPQNCSSPTPFVFAETTLFDAFYNFDFGGCCRVDEFSEVEAGASLSALAQEMKRIPESKAYIYLYKSNWTTETKKSSAIKKWRKTVIKNLTNNGIEPSRIIVKYGGYRNQTATMELWFVPKNGEIPKPKPD